MNVSDDLSELTQFILELKETCALDLVKSQLEQGKDPFIIINDAQTGLNLVGKRYEEGQYYVMGMMMAGEIFREIMELVHPYLKIKYHKNEEGTVLIGTVKGDIHDIGKNLFSMILQAFGYAVEDLGVDVPAQTFVQKASEIRPDIVALSGLLTVSYDTMETTARLLHQSPDPTLAKTPLIVGGGMVNGVVCAHVGADYWASDAMAGVQLCQQIIAKKETVI